MSKTLTPQAAQRNAAAIATPFVRKLYRILDHESAAIVSWDASGESFTIYDEEQLESQVLPRYFRGRIDAFRQQLMEHGFQRMLSRESKQPTMVRGETKSYQHESFVRGEPSRLSRIVRVPSSRRRRGRTMRGETTNQPMLTISKSSVKSSGPNPLFMNDEDDMDIAALLSMPFDAQPDSKGTGAHSTTDGDSLHESLAKILASHIVHPFGAALYATGKSSQDGCANVTSTAPFECMSSSWANGVVETGQFSDDMLHSMVEWLDTTG